MKADAALEELSWRLREVGLDVGPVRARGRGASGIMVLRGDDLPPVNGISVIDGDSAEILRGEDRLVFSHWRYVPGPGPNDFEHEVNAVGGMVALTRQFFFGTPITIGEWLVPLHRHPELNEPALRRCLAQARPASPSDWHPALGTKPPVSKWAILFEPKNPSSAQTLYVARDLSVAAIHQDKRCPSCSSALLLRTGWTFDWEAQYVCGMCRQPSQRRAYQIRLSR